MLGSYRFKVHVTYNVRAKDSRLCHMYYVFENKYILVFEIFRCNFWTKVEHRRHVLKRTNVNYFYVLL